MPGGSTAAPAAAGAPAAAADSYPCPAVRADPVLAAAYDVMLDVGPRRATLAEVARRAGVSRMTLYRRHAQLRTLVSEVLTAELTMVLAQAASAAEAGTDAERIAGVVARAGRAIGTHPLMLRIIELDPQALLPVLVERRGSTQRVAEQMLTEMLISSGDGSVRQSDPQAMARAIVTATSAFIYTERLARAEGDDTRRWSELELMVRSYLS